MPLDPSAGSQDALLVKRMAGGDEAALAELYDRHARQVYAVARAVVRQAEDADEVTTDVFVQVWTSAGRYDAGRGAVMAWLLTLARSRSLDRVRSRGRRAARVERSAAMDGGSFAIPVSRPGPDPERGAEVSELRGRVGEALSGLPDVQRKAVELAFFEGLSQREVAQRLDEPLGTVKSRIRSAMRSLRDALAPLAREGEA